jgi:hypothetical protein
MSVGRVFGWTAAAVLAVSVVSLLTGSAFAAHQPLGALTQLSGKGGCFTYNGSSEDGAGTCSQARGLAEGESAAVSPDGSNVYVGSYGYSSASLGPAYAVFKRNKTTGSLSQLPGKAGCFTSDGASNAGAATCTEMRGLNQYSGDGHDIVFSSNGKWAYIAADGNPAAVMIFRRSASTGALTQLSGTAGCITTNGSSQAGAGTCKADPHLLDASGLTLSSDDRFLYVTGTGGSKQIEVYSRNKNTGALSDIECISQAPAPSGCLTGRVVGDTQYIALSPDGKHAYAGQYDFGISVFDRNPTSGKLTQKSGKAGCVTGDGDDDTGASTCTVGRVTEGTFPLLVTPNGKWLYDTGFEGFSTFRIDSSGGLSQESGTNGCMTKDGKDNNGASTCAIGRAVDDPYGGAISPDGRSLYISDYGSFPVGGVAVFLLNPATGGTTQLAGTAGCVTTDGSTGYGGPAGKCANGRALAYGYGMTVSPDGKSVYQAVDSGAYGGVAIYHRKTAPPVLSGLHISGRTGHLLISFKLNVPDLVTVTFSRGGHRLSGRLVEQGKAGANKFRFGGKVGGHLLGQGTYQATATPVGGKPKKTKFTLGP